MAIVRFVLGLLGLTFLIGGTVWGIVGFWGVSRSDPDALINAFTGIVAALLGGVLILRAPHLTGPRQRRKEDPDVYLEPELRTAAPRVGSSLLGAILGVFLLIGGTIYGVLGLWGMTRGSFDAPILAVAGTLVAIAGGAIVLHALRHLNEPKG